MYKYFLYLLKLGTLLNLYFLYKTLTQPLLFVDIHLRIPAQIFFTVSAFRCFFPVSYATGAVLHDSLLSSIFLTRLFATFSEVAYIYLFSYLIRLFNASQVPLIDVLSWLMVVQVVISQFFVWCAILTERQKFYFYEEVGWAVIFIFYTAASTMLYGTSGSLGSWKLLLELNLLFGALYLPWQFFHLKTLQLRAKAQKINEDMHADISWSLLKKGLYQSVQVKNLTTRSEAWGGIIGMTWMLGYFVAIIPIWIYLILRTV
jgi:hypothetical protein